MGTLYVVPTPIGNLSDITLRALETLKIVDAVICEDTRVTGNLLRHFEIQKPLISFHIQNEHRQVSRLVEELQAGKTFCQVSDAGMPGVSDPGFLLIRACVDAEIPVITLPGPSAFVTALVGSGLPCDRFCFEGFLPHKKGRQTAIERLITEEKTIVFYESPHRIAKTLRQLAEKFGPQRRACVAREISKIYETYHRGTLEELATLAETQNLKGEMVLVVEGFSPIKRKKSDADT